MHSLYVHFILLILYNSLHLQFKVTVHVVTYENPRILPLDLTENAVVFICNYLDFQMHIIFLEITDIGKQAFSQKQHS